MANIVSFIRGTKAAYANLDAAKKANSIYFSTDTHEIISNGQTYGFDPSSSGLISSISYTAPDTFTVEYTNGTSETLTLTKVTTTVDGLMSKEDKVKLDGIDEGAQVNVLEGVQVDGADVTITEKKVNIDLSGKVDKVDGKGLSTNDYTTEEKTKLSGVETGAQVNVLESIKVGGTAQTVTDKEVDLPVYTKTEVDDKVAAAVGKVYKIKGSVATVADLPTEGNIAGDVYNVIAADEDTHTPAGTNYVYIDAEGTEGEEGYVAAHWDALGGSIDMTPYAKTDDVNTALDGKVDKVEGKSLVDDTQITKLTSLDDKATIDAAIADAKKAGTDAQAEIGTKAVEGESPVAATGLYKYIDDKVAAENTELEELKAKVGDARVDGDTPAEPTGIFKIIEDNEKVTAEALVDLNSRVGKNTSLWLDYSQK